MITHFMRTRDIFGLNFREQEIFVLLKRTLTKPIRKQGNSLKGNKGEKVKFSRDQGNIPFPLEGTPQKRFLPLLIKRYVHKVEYIPSKVYSLCLFQIKTNRNHDILYLFNRTKMERATDNEQQFF